MIHAFMAGLGSTTYINNVADLSTHGESAFFGKGTNKSYKFRRIPMTHLQPKKKKRKRRK